MASSTLPFRLKSYQTALAIVAPTQIHADINSLRKIHDKAYERWDPHINLLYPFVDADQLGDAIAALRKGIEEHDLQRLDITLAGPDKFVQKKAATVHLKPDLKSEDMTAQLRAALVRALGRDPKEGTHDGIFRAHMTIGQAGLLGPTPEKLVEKVAKLAPLSWECRSLTVLKRQPSGRMVPVDEIWLRGKIEATADEKEQLRESAQHWKPCHHHSLSEGWLQLPENRILKGGEDTNHDWITISTYNLMADSQAPPFKSRMTTIVNAIVSVQQKSNVRVLCLQEVSDEMLPLLLKDSTICKMYPYSTHQPSSLLPSDRNQLTMASVPFKHTTLHFAERHKAALVIDLVGMSTKIANVHLSAGLSDDAVSAKKRQIDVLTKFCLEHNIGEVIQAGDFNLTTSSRTIEVALDQGLISSSTARVVRDLIDLSLWEDSFLLSGADEETEGATFDRIGNPLAALSISPIDDSPQRYDRILYRRGGRFIVERTQLFGLPDENGHCGSDHYGFSATLCVDQKHKISQCVPQASANLGVGSILVTEDNMDLDHLLQSQLPTENDREQRRRAIALVQETLSSGNGLSNLILAPLGSYLLDTYFPDSDVDLLAIGSVSSQVFFELASFRLRHLDTGTSNSVNGVHLINSLVSIAEFCILDIKFDLQYCQAPILLKRYHNANSIIPLQELASDKTLVSSLPPSSLRPFNTYRDTAYILNTVADISSYRTVHRFLSLYLKRNGLYSAKFGYLGGIHLSLMLNRVVKLMETQFPSEPNTDSKSTPKFSPATIVRTFFNYYANFAWAAESVSDPNLTNETQPPRPPRDAVFIPAIHVPTARPNVASSCTPLSAQTFTDEFKAASGRLASGGWESCLRPNAGVQNFLAGFSAYISLSLDVWGMNEIGGAKVRGIIGALESKFPRLMLALGRLEGIYARVWPARLRNLEVSTERDDSSQGCYLVGVQITDEHSDSETKKILRGKVTAAVRDFENNVKTSREFESGNCWLNSEFLAGKKIRDLKLVVDDRDWSSGKVESTTQMNAIDEAPNLDGVSLPTLSTRPQAEESRRPNTTPLRMPLDIINRIKHDTEHFSAAEFLIGYEDRFEEQPKEIELLKWKLEQTDEEFIPLHRVVHIRRKDENGGGVVWDRRRRLDLIFGSGKRRGND